jgi:hypothetical protein
MAFGGCTFSKNYSGAPRMRAVPENAGRHLQMTRLFLSNKSLLALPSAHRIMIL